MENTDSVETNKDIIPIYGIEIIRFWGKNELTLQQFALENELPVYEPGKVSPLSKDELQNYPTEKIPYLVFDKRELSEFQAFTRSKLPQIDNLPVLEDDDIDKEKEDLFLKINDLHDRNKMHPFDQTVSKELEERKFEYYKKYKKGFSGVIDDDWFWQIRFDFPPPIERSDENKERAIWIRHIQPIVKLHNLKNQFSEQFQYKFFSYPKTIPERQIYLMLRETMVFCQALHLKSDDFPKEVMGKLASDITKVTVKDEKNDEKKVDLKDPFHTFLVSLFEEERLPYFLELLDREYITEDNNSEKPEIDSALQDTKSLPKSKQFEDLTASNSKNKETVQDFESFIRELKVTSENDNKVKFQPYRKKSVTRSIDIIFDGNEKLKESFMEILQKPHTYDLGPSSINRQRIKSYENKRDRLRRMDKKLRSFLNKEFTAIVQIPFGFKLYELCKEEKNGTYRFIFKVEEPSNFNGKIEETYNSLTEKDLLEVIKKLKEQYYNKEIPDDNKEIFKELIVAAKIAVKKNYMSRSDLEKMLELDKNKDKDKEDIRYDPHENEEPKEIDY